MGNSGCASRGGGGKKGALNLPDARRSRSDWIGCGTSSEIGTDEAVFNGADEDLKRIKGVGLTASGFAFGELLGKVESRTIPK
jgi:hypothetical protein